MQFEWDLEKSIINLDKHGISFQDATTVFRDPLSYTFYDPDHSDDELRFLTFGLASSGKLILVSHTERENSIRIISARELNKQERKFFKKGN